MFMQIHEDQRASHFTSDATWPDGNRGRAADSLSQVIV